jgi:hypothetical protein
MTFATKLKATQLSAFPDPSPGILLYIAGAFSSSRINPSVLDNIHLAQKVGHRFANRGYAVFIPHLNYGGLYLDSPCPSWDSILERCLDMIKRCDAAVFCPNWEDSNGALIEHDVALARKLPIKYCLWQEVHK